MSVYFLRRYRAQIGEMALRPRYIKHCDRLCGILFFWMCLKHAVTQSKGELQEKTESNKMHLKQQKMSTSPKRL